MAVRTTLAGIKNIRRVDARSAQPSQQASNGRRSLFRDEAAALRKQKVLERVTLGPASKVHEPKHAWRWISVRGRKKAPSQMHVKLPGGPGRRMPLHGG